MSHAGFSSIVSFYDATNIPDWIILEAGDPETEREKLLDRSPITHVDRLDSPILLTHGSNDNRVGVTESRAFVEAARALEKPVTYVEFEGQGHGISGLENQVNYYQTRFDFLENVVCGVEGEQVEDCVDGN
jgi:dipeptidyl aminopeptidase/acylaminoacyl peptidase